MHFLPILADLLTLHLLLDLSTHSPLFCLPQISRLQLISASGRAADTAAQLRDRLRELLREQVGTSTGRGRQGPTSVVVSLCLIGVLAQGYVGFCFRNSGAFIISGGFIISGADVSWGGGSSLAADGFWLLGA